MKNAASSIALCFGLTFFVSESQAQITYNVTSGASGSFTSSGNIFDGATNIGTWTSNITNATTISNATFGNGTINPLNASVVSVTLATLDSAPGLGLAVSMRPFTTTPGTPGVLTYNITFSATVNPGYSVVSSFISGRVVPGADNFGPNIKNGTDPAGIAATLPNTNVLTISGFTGNAVLTDTGDNLEQATGYTISSGGNLNWKAGNRTNGDWSGASVDWYLTIPTISGQTISYSANFGQGANGIYTTAYNESLGFGFAIVPEPSSLALLGAGAFVLTMLRRRRASQASGV